MVELSTRGLVSEEEIAESEVSDINCPRWTYVRLKSSQCIIVYSIQNKQTLFEKYQIKEEIINRWKTLEYKGQEKQGQLKLGPNKDSTFVRSQPATENVFI